MEARLGDDFSDVRVHTGSTAAESAAAVDARAYTVGTEVVLGAGVTSLDSADGRRILAHELTHVRQQRQGPVDGTDTGAGVAISDPSDRFEQDAEVAARNAMSLDTPIPDGAGHGHGTVESHAAPSGVVAQRDGGDQGADELALDTSTSYFGHVPEGGVVKGFGAILKRAEADAQTRIQNVKTAASAFSDADWQVQNIKGKHVGGLHTPGLAIDLDYALNPYVANEDRERQVERDASGNVIKKNGYQIPVVDASGNPVWVDKGETTLVDTNTKPIYDRIALLFLGRLSVIPDGGARATYDSLKAESDAMVKYFAMMGDGAEKKKLRDDAVAAAQLSNDQWAHIFGGQTVAPGQRAAQIDPIIKHDYQSLSAGPAGVKQSDGSPDPTIPALPGRTDRPFDNKRGGAAGRDPAKGFLTIRKEIVQALRGQGLRWGGTDFGTQNGDIMHFDTGYSSPLYQASGRAHVQKLPVQRLLQSLPLERLVVQRHEAGDEEVISEQIINPPELAEEERADAETATD